jgi:hypothetical protein
MYERDVTGDLEAAHRTLQLWAETYPRDPRVHGLLAGFIAQGTGDTNNRSMKPAKLSRSIPTSRPRI